MGSTGLPETKAPLLNLMRQCSDFVVPVFDFSFFFFEIEFLTCEPQESKEKEKSLSFFLSPSGLTASRGNRASAALRAIVIAAPSLAAETEEGDADEEAELPPSSLSLLALRSMNRNCSARDHTPKKGIEATCFLAAQQGCRRLTTARPSR